METTHHQHNCDAQMTTLLGEVRNGVRFLVLQYALHQTLVAAMDARRELLALRTWHTGKVTRDAHHQFVGAWINGVNRDSSGKVKH